jgi:pyruvate/2-oxoacid:ferredoxin oxidoreductase beta subunit
MSDGNGHKLTLTAKEFRTDQEVRWCPGCGDYAILAAMQSFMPELGIERERTVFISGIGCAARTGCTRSTAARRRSRRGSPCRGRTCPSGS